MKRKQVMAMLLALSMAAANVVTAPMDAYASISVAEGVGSVGTAEETKTTVTLKADVADESKIYISADDVDGDKTVTIAVDGTTYTKIMKADSEPNSTEDFSGAETAKTLGESDFADSNTQVTLYLLKDGAEDTTTDGNMRSITVNIDKTATTVGETFTVGGKSVKSAVTLNATDVAGGATLALSATTKDSGAVAISYAVGTEAKSATAEDMAGVVFNAYSDDSKPSLDLVEGANYVYVELVDAVGNVAYACSDEITVDTTAPTISSVKVADNDALASALYLDAANPTLTVESEEATVTYALGDEKKDQAALKEYDSSITGSVAEGSATLTMADAAKKYIYIKAVDAAGNASYACTKLVTIDATAPTLATLTAAGSDATSEVTVGAENPALVLEANEDTTTVSISYATGETQINNKDDFEKLSYTTYDAQAGATLTLANGASTYVYVKLKDQAENETYACSGKITVDTAAPGCTFTPTGEDNASIINADNYEYNINEGNVKVAFAALEGDTITGVTVDDQSNESAKTNGYAIFDTAGEHTVEVALKHNANNNTATKTITVKCYKQVDVSAADAVTKAYGDSLAVTELYKDLNAKYTESVPTTVYIENEADTATEDVQNALKSGTTGLPTDAGTYWIKTTFPAKGYFLGNSVYTKLTISQKSGVTASYNGTVTVQYTDETGREVDLANTVAQYKSADETLSYSVGEITGEGSASVTAEDGNGSIITVKGNNTDPSEDKDATIPVTVTGFKNYDSITVSIQVKVTQNAVADLEIVGAADKIYDGVAQTITCKIDEAEPVSSADGLTISISKSDAGTVSEIKDAGTYTITASFSGESGGETKTGYATKTITVSKRPLTVTFANTEVTEGTDPGNVTYPTAPTYTGLAAGQSATPTGVLNLSSEYSASAKAGETFAYTGCPENNGIKVTAGEVETDLSSNYEITVQNQCHLVKFITN